MTTYTRHLERNYCWFPHFTNHYMLSLLQATVSSQSLLGNSSQQQKFFSFCAQVVTVQWISHNWTVNLTMVPYFLCLSCRIQLSTDWVANLGENTVSNSNSIVECMSVAARICLLILCQETGCITPLFISLFHSHCIIMAIYATILKWILREIGSTSEN
jgi:hypothetical protein